MGGDGGKDQEGRCLFSVQSCERERWNRKMKEQPAYASQEQNPFITSVIFNFQQLYQHLQLSLPKSHMTCSQPTIDKPYGASLKGRFCFRWENNWAGRAGGVGWCGVKVRDNATAPDRTTHFIFSQRSFTTELFSKQVYSVGLRLRSYLICGDNGLPQIPPHSALRVPANTGNLQLWLPFCIHLNIWFCGIYSVGGSGLIESLLFQTVS